MSERGHEPARGGQGRRAEPDAVVGGLAPRRDGAVTPLIPPELNADTEPFWRGCAEGRLVIARCRSCGLYLHPPRPACRRCRSMDIGREEVSGRGVVHSFTRAHHAFIPGMPVPYVIAIVELVEQPGLRMMTNVVGCEPDAVRIGQPVHAVFVPFSGRDDIAAPHFVPDAGAG